MTKIDRIETTIVDLPTIRGHVLSMTTMMLQSIVLVRITFSDGSEGIGEGTSIGGMSYGAEIPESIKSAIDTYIAPLLDGSDGDQINAVIDIMDRGVKGNPIARCAVETALWDGLAKRLGVSVARLFGGPVRAAMPVAWTLASVRRRVEPGECRLIMSGAAFRSPWPSAWVSSACTTSPLHSARASNPWRPAPHSISGAPPVQG